MELDEIKKKLDREGKFYAFICPDCGEINSGAEERYDEIVSYYTYADNDGIVHSGDDETLDRTFIETKMSDCKCNTSWRPEDLLVLVFRDKKGVIKVDLIGDLNEEYSQEEIEELMELLEERYGGEIKPTSMEECAITEEDNTDEKSDDDVLKNWR